MIEEEPAQFAVVVVYRSSSSTHTIERLFGPYGLSRARIAAKFINDSFTFDDIPSIESHDLTPPDGYMFVKAIPRRLQPLGRFSGEG